MMLKLPAKLNENPRYKNWLLQAIFIGFAVLLSIFTITWILEKSLVKQAMELEADAFISQYIDDNSFPLPRTRNLIGYLSTPNKKADIPRELTDLSAGLHPEISIKGRTKPVPVYIREFKGHRLYLIFEGANIDRLVGVFGLVPMSILLILIYTSSWIAYRIALRAASPLMNIAQNLRKIGPDDFTLNLPKQNLSGETKELADALDEYTKRIEAFVERERQFTADVSHELRTPMTIIDAAAQFLETEENISDKSRDRIKMIRRACFDINELTSAFFLLARGEKDQFNSHITSVAEIVEQEVSKLQMLIDTTKVNLNVDITDQLNVKTHRKALEIILSNLIGNAVKYTDQGSIDITVTNNQVLINDTGIGIPNELITHLFERHVRGRGLNQAGQGIGLSIVKRLCDQFNWDINISNRPNQGVKVMLTKP